MHTGLDTPRKARSLTFALSALALLGTLLATGCITTGRPKHDEKLAALIARLETAQDPAERSDCADALRGALDLHVRGASGDAENFEFPSLRLEKIELALDTGPRNWIGDEGDDGIVVTVIPKDQFGHTIKIPCTMNVELFRKRPLGGFRGRSIVKWPTLSPAKVNSDWVDSTFSGYHVKLPWPTTPQPTKPVVLVVTITTRSGQTASAEKTHDDGIRP